MGDTLKVEKINVKVTGDPKAALEALSEGMQSLIPSAPRTAILVEALDLTEAQINLEERTVRQTIIRAGKSKNRRVYPEGVLEAATPLF